MMLESIGSFKTQGRLSKLLTALTFIVSALAFTPMNGWAAASQCQAIFQSDIDPYIAWIKDISIYHKGRYLQSGMTAEVYVVSHDHKWKTIKYFKKLKNKKLESEVIERDVVMLKFFEKLVTDEKLKLKVKRMELLTTPEIDVFFPAMKIQVGDYVSGKSVRDWLLSDKVSEADKTHIRDLYLQTLESLGSALQKHNNEAVIEYKEYALSEDQKNWSSMNHTVTIEDKLILNKFTMEKEYRLEVNKWVETLPVYHGKVGRFDFFFHSGNFIYDPHTGKITLIDPH